MFSDISNSRLDGCRLWWIRRFGHRTSDGKLVRINYSFDAYFHGES